MIKNFSDLTRVRGANALEDLAPFEPKDKLALSHLNTWIHTLKLKEWEMGKDEKREFMKRQFSFKNFKQAFLFMKLTASVADRLDHHPEWFNVFNRVEVLLSTHTANGLTIKDIILAYEMAIIAKTAENATEEQLVSVYSISESEKNLIDSRFLEIHTKTRDMKIL